VKEKRILEGKTKKEQRPQKREVPCQEGGTGLPNEEKGGKGKGENFVPRKSSRGERCRLEGIPLKKGNPVKRRGKKKTRGMSALSGGERGISSSKKAQKKGRGFPKKKLPREKKKKKGALVDKKCQPPQIQKNASSPKKNPREGSEEKERSSKKKKKNHPGKKVETKEKKKQRIRDKYPSGEKKKKEDGMLRKRGNHRWRKIAQGGSLLKKDWTVPKGKKKGKGHQDPPKKGNDHVSKRGVVKSLTG